MKNALVFILTILAFTSKAYSSMDPYGDCQSETNYQYQYTTGYCRSFATKPYRSVTGTTEYCNVGCVSAAPGYYLVALKGSYKREEACPKGYYCTGGTADKQACPAGKTTNDVRAYAVEQCNVSTSSTTPTASVCVEEYVTEVDKSVSLASGYKCEGYSTSNGNSSHTESGGCVAGKFKAYNHHGTNCFRCLECKMGYEHTRFNGCIFTRCPANYYAKQQGAGKQCIACPAGTTSPAGSTKAADCVAPIAYACTVEHGHGTPDSQGRCASLVCDSGYYPIGGGGSCGSTGQQYSASACIPESCRSSGGTVTPSVPSGPSKCTLANGTCSGQAYNGSSGCTCQSGSCNSGYDKKMVYKDNSMFSGSSFYCQQQLVACYEGFTCCGNGCAECTSANEKSNRQCIFCAQDYYLSTSLYGFGDNNGCTKCPTGTHSSVGSVGIDSCKYTSCPKGKLLSDGKCLDCPVGTYQPNDNSTAKLCISCPIGYSTSDVGTTALIDCVPEVPNCPEGATTAYSSLLVENCADVALCRQGRDDRYYCRNCNSGYVLQNGTCVRITTSCQAGYFLPDPRAGCQICPKNAYCPQGAITPTPCPSGYVTETTGSKSVSDCKALNACPGGTSSIKTYTSCPDECSNCMECLANGTKKYMCTACRVGATWVASYQECLQMTCPSGYKIVHASSIANCQNSGMCWDNGPAMFCRSCDNGYTLNANGLCDRNGCAKGYYQGSSNICTKCQVGYVQPDDNSFATSCTKCATGLTSNSDFTACVPATCSHVPNSYECHSFCENGKCCDNKDSAGNCVGPICYPGYELNRSTGLCEKVINPCPTDYTQQGCCCVPKAN
ncbi:MAG: hypothetical protein MJ247_05945 [Alphaproteobacteria bacterium]|nr:hypothetical protein [Alphaproteobacteria bacterium]